MSIALKHRTASYMYIHTRICVSECVFRRAAILTVAMSVRTTLLHLTIMDRKCDGPSRVCPLHSQIYLARPSWTEYIFIKDSLRACGWRSQEKKNTRANVSIRCWGEALVQKCIWATISQQTYADITLFYAKMRYIYIRSSPSNHIVWASVTKHIFALCVRSNTIWSSSEQMQSICCFYAECCVWR